MKPYISYSILAAALSCGMAQAAVTSYSIPVGFVTETIKASSFNTMGLTMHPTVVAAGVLDADSAISVTDNDVNFTTLLTPGITYILEITSGIGAVDDGIIQEITAWSGSVLTTPEDLSALVDAASTYKLRPAATVSSVFGAANSALLQSSANADPSEADVIYIPDGLGGFTQVFYSTAASPFDGWLDANTFAQVPTQPIVYADGFYLERKGGTDLPLVVNGEIKKSNTKLMISDPFTLISSVSPVGSTLANSNLSSALQASANADPSEADVVYLPDGLGGFKQAFFSTAASPFDGWLDSNTFAQIPTEPLTHGMLIERKAPSAYSVKLTVPSFYPSL